PKCQGACFASRSCGARSRGHPLQRWRGASAAHRADRHRHSQRRSSSMISNRELFDVITIAALKGCDCDVAGHKETVWDSAVCLMADVLRNSDELSRERLLRGLVEELRESIDRLEELLRPQPSSFPRTPSVH